MLAKLELNPEMEDDEMIRKVAEAFCIKPDYESINVEVTYSVKTDKEYEAFGS